jgi:hypothetical protein
LIPYLLCMPKFVLLIDTTMSRFAVGSHIIVGRVNAQFGNDKMNAAIEAAFVLSNTLLLCLDQCWFRNSLPDAPAT